MGPAVQAGAAVARSTAALNASTAGPSIRLSIAHSTPEPADITAMLAGCCPEIDCVRALIAADVAEAAERRAAGLGIGADRVLIAAGVISEEAYLHALARAHDVPFETLDGVPRSLCPLNDERLIEAVAAGILPLTENDELYLVIAPRGVTARRIAGLVGNNLPLARRFRFTSAERLNRFVLRYAGKAIAARAAGELKRAWPMLSAALPRWRSHLVFVAVAALLGLAAAVTAPMGTRLVFDVVLAAVFLAWLALRLSAAFVTRRARDPWPGLSDEALPVYTVIAALYREAASVDELIRAIERLDYPALGSKCTKPIVAA